MPHRRQKVRVRAMLPAGIAGVVELSPQARETACAFQASIVLQVVDAEVPKGKRPIPARNSAAQGRRDLFAILQRADAGRTLAQVGSPILPPDEMSLATVALAISVARTSLRTQAKSQFGCPCATVSTAQLHVALYAVLFWGLCETLASN